VDTALAMLLWKQVVEKASMGFLHQLCQLSFWRDNEWVTLRLRETLRLHLDPPAGCDAIGTSLKYLLEGVQHGYFLLRISVPSSIIFL
jgi:hypothetical protein